MTSASTGTPNPDDPGNHNDPAHRPGSPGTDPGRGRPLTIGWVVDVQRDFMEPEGRLYVRHLGDPTDEGASAVRARIVEAVEWLRARCEVMVFTGDWHGLDDEEIDPVAPDPARGTYPPHCMGRSTDEEERSGAELIPEIAPHDPLVLDVDAVHVEGSRIAREALESARNVFIRKTRFDVFAGNAATEAFVAELARSADDHLEFIVFGVARDVCVTQAVDGLQQRGRRVRALRDATWGLGLEQEQATLERWARTGTVCTLDELRARF